MTPEAIKKLAHLLSQLPSLGPRQAMRLAFHIASLPKDDVLALSEATRAAARIKLCKNCFSLSAEDSDICAICSDRRRDQTVVAIVEKETDRLTLEKTGKYTGRYAVLGDLPKDGILTAEHKRRLSHLKKSGSFSEIILALSPTTYGDLNASILQQELKDNAEKITRLGRGIPTGGEIEFADEETLENALKNRS